MTKEKLSEFANNVEKIAYNFEETPWTDNVKFLKEDFDIKKAESPKHYQEVLREFAELTRQTRLLFVMTVLEKVCIEEGKIYNFDVPYKANIEYTGVLKKDLTFYLVDEDGDFKDVFTSENFVHFIDDQYWELFDETIPL